jgi:hypothetical protein
MRWTVHGEKPLYKDEWLDIRLAGVELPDGRRLYAISSPLAARAR